MQVKASRTKMDPSTGTRKESWLQHSLTIAGHGFVPTQRNDTYPFIDPLKLNLQGQNVLITGGSRGIGKAIAISYARAGASGIVVLDILDAEPVLPKLLEAAKAAGRSPPKVLSVKVDVTSEESVAEAAKAVSAQFDSLDFVINNAGVLAGYIPILETNPSRWWREWSVNVKGPYLISRAFLPLVLKSTQKTFVVMSSVGAHFTLPGGSAYESSKLAVLKLNYYLNLEHDGVLAYAIAPGGVKTVSSPSQRVLQVLWTTNLFKILTRLQDMAATFPVHLHDRLTDTPEMCADTLTFLTNERRDWLANRYVDTRWDMKEFMAKKDEIVARDLLKVRMAL
jgi:NAD(P)-dependent dehydrogenase (short-subunit alcohol dehydrogenase family)